MRVVMVTDDTIIDRRILLEAESLYAAGHEVILLAGVQEGGETFERLGNIKVERVPIPEYSRTETHLLRVSAFLSGALARLSTVFDKIFYKLSLLSNKVFSVLSTIPSRVFSLFISMVTRTIGLFITGGRRLRRLPLYETAIVDRLLFYRPDVIHVHDLPRLRVGAIAKSSLKIPLIYDAHEFYPEQPRLTDKQRARLKRLESRYIKKADVVITVNPFLARAMEEAYRGVDVDVLENAIDPPPNFNPEAGEFGELREECRLAPDDILVLYQGWIATERNLENMIKGMSGVEKKNVKLLIMGYGDYGGELDKLAHESGVASKVVFVPSKNQEELLFYTASADIGLIPYPYGKDLNTHFVSPNKLYEFISAGVPILSNKLPFVCEVVEGNNFGVCADLQSPEGFARAINEFPWGKLKTFKENILRERRRFEWTVQSIRLLKIYTAIQATEGSETPQGQTEKYSSPRRE